MVLILWGKTVNGFLGGWFWGGEVGGFTPPAVLPRGKTAPPVGYLGQCEWREDGCLG